MYDAATMNKCNTAHYEQVYDTATMNKCIKATMNKCMTQPL